MSIEPSNEKDLLREEFELISANIKSILTKNREKVSASDKDFILAAIKVHLPLFSELSSLRTLLM